MSRFKVLWIDDQKRKCKKDVKSVERIIESLGFEPDIKVVDDISIESLNNGVLACEIKARDVDLFVVDYNLKNNLFGNDVVKEIRTNNNIYTDIVFYSSMSDSLISAVKSSFDADSIMEFFDGVYIAPLGDEFTEKINYVITKTIKSWYNVHSIRGILLSKVSKFEQMAAKIIEKNYMACLSEIIDALNAKGENVCRTTKIKWNSVKVSSDPIPNILDDPINFNWAVKKTILQQLTEEGIVSISSWDDIEYLFSLRNKFAHNPIHLKDGVLVLNLNDEDEYYSESDIDNLRAVLTRVENDLEKILRESGFDVSDFGFTTCSGKELCVV